MRLINTSSITVKEFVGDAVPPYAILSHTWENEEVTLQDITSDIPMTKSGMNKIKGFCEQASRDGFDWGWVDTCCINKESSAELSEAINSMFRWYEKSQVCYVYLADVQYHLSHLGHCPHWFTRGWTLQELLAPADVEFFDGAWVELGSKQSLAKIISAYTGIPQALLLDPGLLSVPNMYSVAEKFSWAANRRTTRVEDRAYSLLGLMDVNMPLLYGEGQRAFQRLQKKVIKTTSDVTVFAWSRRSHHHPDNPDRVANLRGLIADSPDDFGLLKRVSATAILRQQPIVAGNSVTLTLPCRSLGRGRFMASLHCSSQYGKVYITLYHNGPGRWLRFEEAGILPEEATNTMLKAYQPQSLTVVSEVMELVEDDSGTGVQAPRPMTSLPTLSLFASVDGEASKLECRLKYFSAAGYRPPQEVTEAFTYTMLRPQGIDINAITGLSTATIPCQNEHRLLAIFKPKVALSSLGPRNFGTVLGISFYKGAKLIVNLIIGISGSGSYTRLHIAKAAGSVPSWDDSSWLGFWRSESNATSTNRLTVHEEVDEELYLVSAQTRRHGKVPNVEPAQGPHYHVDIKLTAVRQRARSAIQADRRVPDTEEHETSLVPAGHDELPEYSSWLDITESV